MDLIARPFLTELLADGTSHVLVQRFELRVDHGPDAGRKVASNGNRIVIGSEIGAELQLEDGAVSRFHCEIVATEGCVQIRDLGSRNGTLVDGVQVTQAVLRPGALLGIGRNLVRFDAVADHARVPLSAEARFGRMVGRSTSMRAVFALLERAASSTATVLLAGETGTGKEAAAESLHLTSPRGDGPFIIIDCGAIPPNLLESELFGHEKGAFTGAATERVGAFEAANGGTIFLDEIGELSIDLQPKLLRVLERREVKRIGSNHYQPVDVRVIAATHRDLRAEVNAKTFRADLFYRLAVVEIRLPALRERLEDLPMLVETLLADVAPSRRFELATASFLAQLATHRWPGNVRELRNYIERCLAMGFELATPPSSTDDDARGPTIDAALPLRVAREANTKWFERAYLEALLQRHGDNLAAASRAAKVDRAHIYRLLWKHGLR
jgi:two-component system, NtrC family, response regulator GlrR